MRLFGKAHSASVGRNIASQTQDATLPPGLTEEMPQTPSHEYMRGLKAAASLLLGVFPFGIIYGTLAVAGGFSPTAVLFMSATVFAGAAQFLAVSLYAAQTAPIAIILAAFIINLRHMLYGITLGQQFRNVPRLLMIAIAFTTIDEVFVLVQTRLQRIHQSIQATQTTTAEPEDSVASPKPISNHDAAARHLHWFALGTATVMYMGWLLASWLGVVGGGLIADPTALGLEFALPATFIALLMPQLRSRPVVVCTIIAGLSALLLQGLPLQSGLIIAIVMGVASAVWVDMRQLSQEQTQDHQTPHHTEPPP
jgi:predicted branched-subunit amino acid permease